MERFSEKVSSIWSVARGSGRVMLRLAGITLVLTSVLALTGCCADDPLEYRSGLIVEILDWGRDATYVQVLPSKETVELAEDCGDRAPAFEARDASRREASLAWALRLDDEGLSSAGLEPEAFFRPNSLRDRRWRSDEDERTLVGFWISGRVGLVLRPQDGWREIPIEGEHMWDAPVAFRPGADEWFVGYDHELSKGGTRSWRRIDGATGRVIEEGQEDDSGLHLADAVYSPDGTRLVLLYRRLVQATGLIDDWWAEMGHGRHRSDWVVEWRDLTDGDVWRVPIADDLTFSDGSLLWHVLEEQADKP